jgi:SsrA-binding protein
VKKKINIINKKAKFEYLLHDSYIAGIVLTGPEIKSVRNSKVSIRESFCKFQNNELFIINMNIEKYEFSKNDEYNPKRLRKLLLNKKELNKLKKSIQQKGTSIIPFRIFISEKGFAKIEIFSATGKKIYDKRSTIKDRDNKRNLEKINKKKIN